MMQCNGAAQRAAVQRAAPAGFKSHLQPYLLAQGEVDARQDGHLKSTSKVWKEMQCGLHCAVGKQAGRAAAGWSPADRLAVASLKAVHQ